MWSLHATQRLLLEEQNLGQTWSVMAFELDAFFNRENDWRGSIIKYYSYIYKINSCKIYCHLLSLTPFCLFKVDSIKILKSNKTLQILSSRPQLNSPLQITVQLCALLVDLLASLLPSLSNGNGTINFVLASLFHTLYMLKSCMTYK